MVHPRKRHIPFCIHRTTPESKKSVKSRNDTGPSRVFFLSIHISSKYLIFDNRPTDHRRSAAFVKPTRKRRRRPFRIIRSYEGEREEESEELLNPVSVTICHCHLPYAPVRHARRRYPSSDASCVKLHYKDAILRPVPLGLRHQPIRRLIWMSEMIATNLPLNISRRWIPGDLRHLYMPPWCQRFFPCGAILNHGQI